MKPEDTVNAVIQILSGTDDAPDHAARLCAFFRARSFAVTVSRFDPESGLLSDDKNVRLPADAEQHALPVIETLHALRQKTVEPYPDIPFYMYANGSASYLLRSYLAVHGDGLNGAVIAGTGYVTPGAGSLKLYCGKLLSLFQGAKERRTAGTGLTLRELTVSACSETHFAGLPKNLPVLLVSGAEDPAGDRGAGVRRVQEKMLTNGMTDVSCRLYPGIAGNLLDDSIADTVLADILAFVRAHTDRSHVSSFAFNKAYAEKKAAEKKDYEIDQILI